MISTAQLEAEIITCAPVIGCHINNRMGFFVQTNGQKPTLWPVCRPATYAYSPARFSWYPRETPSPRQRGETFRGSPRISPRIGRKNAIGCSGAVQLASDRDNRTKHCGGELTPDNLQAVSTCLPDRPSTFLAQQERPAPSCSQSTGPATCNASNVLCEQLKIFIAVIRACSDNCRRRVRNAVFFCFFLMMCLLTVRRGCGVE